MTIKVDVYTRGHAVWHNTYTEEDIIRFVKHDLLESDSLTDDTEIVIDKVIID